MKIEEARKNLEDALADKWCPWSPELKDSIKLGIEALKHYQDSSHFAIGCLLPGQTGETEE